MDQSRPDSDPHDVEALLASERPLMSPLVKDQVRRRVLAQAPPTKTRGTILKSRLALTLMLATGLLMTGSGATLAVTAPSGGDASISQYSAPGDGSLDNPGGDTEPGGANGPGDDLAGEGIAGEEETGGEPTSGDGAVPGSGEVAAANSGGSDQLPFTGGFVLPLLLIGVALTAVGGVLRLRLSRESHRV